MPGKSILELKILWYLNNIENYMDKEALSIIKLAQFDDDGVLQIPSTPKTSELYKQYWENLSKRIESTEENEDSE